MRKLYQTVSVTVWNATVYSSCCISYGSLRCWAKKRDLDEIIISSLSAKWTNCSAPTTLSSVPWRYSFQSCHSQDPSIVRQWWQSSYTITSSMSLLMFMVIPGRCELNSCARPTMVMGRKYLNFLISVGSMLLIFLTCWHTLVSDIIRS